MDTNPIELRCRRLTPNSFLKKTTYCYYVLDYLGYHREGNPNFLLTFKNTFEEKGYKKLCEAKETLISILRKYIPIVMNETGLSSCVMIPVPRAKALNTYTDRQLFFQDGVSEAAKSIAGVKDGKDIFERYKSTKTTHLNPTVSRVTAAGTKEINVGKAPYPGITKDTCIIDAKAVRTKDIILVDDIYTNGINVDEDCIQALYDAGAKSVVLFAVANTV